MEVPRKNQQIDQILRVENVKLHKKSENCFFDFLCFFVGYDYFDEFSLGILNIVR